MTKNTLKIVNNYLQNKNIPQSRKNTIVASIQQAASGAPMTEEAIINTIEKLLQHTPTSLLAYASDCKCAKCYGKMETVFIYDKRQADYCPRCRIAMPKPVQSA